MDSFHCSISVHSRSDGRSAVGGAAYRAGICLVDARTGKVHDHSQRTRDGDILDSYIVAPEQAPPWVYDRQLLWDGAEAAENRRNSCVAREITVDIPAAFDDAEKKRLGRTIANHLRDTYGVVVDVAQHRPSPHGDQLNHHFHFYVTTRKCDATGFTTKTRDLDNRNSGHVEAFREFVANAKNDAYARLGLDHRVSHLSYARRGIERIPTIHLGRAAAEERRTGKPTPRGDRNREIIATNAALTEAKAATAAAAQRVHALEAQIRREAFLASLGLADKPSGRGGQVTKIIRARVAAEANQRRIAAVATADTARFARAVPTPSQPPRLPVAPVTRSRPTRISEDDADAILMAAVERAGRKASWQSAMPPVAPLRPVAAPVATPRPVAMAPAVLPPVAAPVATPRPVAMAPAVPRPPAAPPAPSRPADAATAAPAVPKPPAAPPAPSRPADAATAAPAVPRPTAAPVAAPRPVVVARATPTAPSRPPTTPVATPRPVAMAPAVPPPAAASVPTPRPVASPEEKAREIFATHPNAERLAAAFFRAELDIPRNEEASLSATKLSAFAADSLGVKVWDRLVAALDAIRCESVASAAAIKEWAASTAALPDAILGALGVIRTPAPKPAPAHAARVEPGKGKTREVER